MTILSKVSMTVKNFQEPFKGIEFIDGMLLPCGVATGVFSGPGKGKTTSQIAASILSATTGEWNMFGSRKHDRKLRSLMLLAEDTRQTLRFNLKTMPFTDEMVEAVVSEGKVSFAPMMESHHQEHANIFDAEGKLKPRGRELFDEIIESGPWDFILFDTLQSFSDSMYIDRKSSYNTTNALNGLAAETGACVIYNSHTAKDGGSNLKADCRADDVIAIASGSGGLIGAARNIIVITECPTGLFDNISTSDKDDLLLLGACKSNLNKTWNGKIFPVIRDAKNSVLRTVDDAGVPLLMSDRDHEQEVQKNLRAFIVKAVRAASEMRQPFSSSARNAFSISSICTGSLAAASPSGTPAQYANAVAFLEKTGKIVACKASRGGSGAVYDTPDGVYANESKYEAIMKEKLSFRKGAPDLELFERRLAEISRRKPDEMSEFDGMHEEVAIAAE